MGISGAMLAESLTDVGLSVVALDRRGPMLGSTAATTALVQFEIDQPIVKLRAMIGVERAADAWRRSRLAVDNLAARIAELGIRCGLVRRPSLYLAGNVLSGGELRGGSPDGSCRGISGALPRAASRTSFWRSTKATGPPSGSIHARDSSRSAGGRAIMRKRTDRLRRSYCAGVSIDGEGGRAGRTNVKSEIVL
jgi:hypothetical protein